MPISISHAFLQLVLVATCTAYPHFQSQIPHGDNVPNPCKEGSPWPGVGHEAVGGAGDRNPFGQDFGRNNANWTAVCSMDSDGDGQTNGQELGDPACQWVPGMPNPTDVKLSHPGVCEPLESSNCKTLNSWLKCPPKFDCPAINQEDVSSIELRIPYIPVPAKETTYMCYGVALPKDKDYHVIAITPLINNSVVLHHMVIYLCKGDISETEMIQRPVECHMGSAYCQTLVGLWGVGLNGQCLDEQYGFPIGASGYKYAMIQLHWNNPLEVTTFMDSSGMTMHYTSKRRPNDAAVVGVGQLKLVIPPKRSSVSIDTVCSSYCTAALPQSVKITEVLVHMHLLGKSAEVELHRNGERIRTLSVVEHYDYNAPRFDTFEEPIELRPGDEVRLVCTFNSMNANKTTYFGEGTQDEMCYVFLTYYPAIDDFQRCQQYGTVNTCSNAPLQCDVKTINALNQRLGDLCSNETCSESCNATMIDMVRTGCVEDDFLHFLTWKVNKDLSQLPGLLQRCGISKDLFTPTSPPPPGNNCGSMHWVTFWTSGILVLATNILVSMARAGKY